MESQDKLILNQMLEDYTVKDFVKILKEVISVHENKLIDNSLADKAKTLSLLAWHLDILEL